MDRTCVAMSHSYAKLCYSEGVYLMEIPPSETPEEREHRRTMNMRMSQRYFGPLNRHGLHEELKPIVARLERRIARLEARIADLEGGTTK